MKLKFNRIGDYIREVKIRNLELKTTTLLGVNIDKFFMPSVANIVGTDMTAYKIVKNGQFACNRMHVGRDYRLPVALSKSTDEFIVSPAYDVFEVIDSDVLLPEYLMMWFSRKEFDRNAWFYTDADIRGGLNWKAFCDMKMPIPKPEKQRELIQEYNVLIKRVELNNKLVQKLEETAKAIYKQWFIDFEFPEANEKPYKSSGGDIEFNKDWGGGIPKGWRVGQLSELIEITSGKTPVDRNDFKNDFFEYPIFGAGGLMGYCSQYLFNEKLLSIGRVGTHGVVKRINFPCWTSDNTLVIKSKYYEYINQILNNINYDEINRGGVQGLITQTDIKNSKTLIPLQSVLDAFESKVNRILLFTDNQKAIIERLEFFQSLVLSKLATIEN